MKAELRHCKTRASFSPVRRVPCPTASPGAGPQRAGRSARLGGVQRASGRKAPPLTCCWRGPEAGGGVGGPWSRCCCRHPRDRTLWHPNPTGSPTRAAARLSGSEAFTHRAPRGSWARADPRPQAPAPESRTSKGRLRTHVLCSVIHSSPTRSHPSAHARVTGEPVRSVRTRGVIRPEKGGGPGPGHAMDGPGGRYAGHRKASSAGFHGHEVPERSGGRPGGDRGRDLTPRS